MSGADCTKVDHRSMSGHTLALKVIATFCISPLVLAAGSCGTPLGARDRERTPPSWSRLLSSLGPTDDVGWHGIPGSDSRHVYIDVGGGVAAIDPATGDVAWHRVIWPGGHANSGNIAVRGARLFVAEEGRVASLDAESGEVRWKRDLDSASSRAVTAVDDRSWYVGRWDARIVALDATDGRVEWSSALGEGWTERAFPTGMAASGDTVYVAIDRFISSKGDLRAGVVVALDRMTGRELWRFQTPGTGRNVDNAPAIGGNVLVLDDPWGNAFFGMDRFTGREIWRVPGEAPYVGPEGLPLISNDTVFVGSNDRHVYAADVRTGRLYWRARVGASVISIGLCSRSVLSNARLIDTFDRSTGRHRSSLFGQSDDDPKGGFPTSGFGVVGNRAVVTGTVSYYGIACP